MAPEERSTLKRFILWDYRRAGWQYDLVVGLILAFIFITPRVWFRDQPRTSSIVPLSAEQYWIEPGLLSGSPDSELWERTAAVLKSRTGKSHALVRVEPIFNAEREVQGYIAYTRR